MNSLGTCLPSKMQINTGVCRTRNCATNDSQPPPADPFDEPCRCRQAVWTKRVNTTDCCIPKSSGEVIFVCGTGGVVSTTLTVTELISGTIFLGMTFTYGGTYTTDDNQILSKPAIMNGIVAFGPGTSGGPGTYTINPQLIPDGTLITSTNNNIGVPLLNSVWEAYRADPAFWGTRSFPGAKNIKGVQPISESERIKAKLYNQSICGFYTTGIPFIPPGCPPTPTEILNGNLPKPSTRANVCPPSRFEGIRNDCDE